MSCSSMHHIYMEQAAHTTDHERETLDLLIASYTATHCKRLTLTFAFTIKPGPELHKFSAPVLGFDVQLVKELLSLGWDLWWKRDLVIAELGSEFAEGLQGGDDGVLRHTGVGLGGTV